MAERVLRDLDQDIPIDIGPHAFDCPEGHGPMALMRRYSVPEKHGSGDVGVWHCITTNTDWYEDGDEWYGRAEADG